MSSWSGGSYHGLEFADLVIFLAIVIFILFFGTVWAVPPA